MEVYKKGDCANTRWGRWEITNVVYADDGENNIPILCEKDITVNPGESLSAQAHYGRSEVYEGLEGITMVCVEGSLFELKKGNQVAIPRGALHFSWVDEEAEIPAVFHEVQSGPLCAEGDIKRGADRRKLNLPNLLNPDSEDVGQSPEQVLLGLRLKVAENRYYHEVEVEGRTIDDYDKNVDFMPKVITTILDYPQGFSDDKFLSVLSEQFKKDIATHLALHEEHTPELKPEVLNDIKSNL